MLSFGRSGWLLFTPKECSIETIFLYANWRRVGAKSQTAGEVKSRTGEA